MNGIFPQNVLRENKLSRVIVEIAFILLLHLPHVNEGTLHICLNSEAYMQIKVALEHQGNNNR